MPSFEHDRLVNRVAIISSPPDDVTEREAWLEAREQLQLLEDNAEEGELIIHAIDDSTFIHTVLVGEDKLLPLDQNDLLRWSGNAFASRAKYTWGGGRNDVRIEQDYDDWSVETLKEAKHLVFGRHLQGFGSDDGAYYEILQEYAHVSELHWRSDQRSYCHFSELGEVEHAVSVTLRTAGSKVDLVSFQREKLEQYLAATNSALVRMFDFMLFVDLSSFRRWPDTPEALVGRGQTLFARQKVDPGKAAYTRGVQIIRPSRPKFEILEEIKSDRDNRYVAFTAHDVRHGRLADISTNPSSTTSYFEAHENCLPFEMSPAFFRPDVLVKYKSDRERYTVHEEHRTITCRGGWELRTYDVNEAGQVHAYIVDLRSLPYQEQLYWKSFNEKPSAAISERAFRQDIKGEWTDMTTPLEDVLATAKAWAGADLPWWKLRSETLAERVTTPHTSSRDEWAGAFLDLANLLVEGFQVKAIRRSLVETGLAFNKDDGSLALIEKLLIGAQILAAGGRLDGLREAQKVRSQVASHTRGRTATVLAREALERHGSYASHFEAVCATITDELKMIEQCFSGKSG